VKVAMAIASANKSELEADPSPFEKFADCDNSAEKK